MSVLSTFQSKTFHHVAKKENIKHSARKTQGDGMGREVGRGFRMGNTCTPEDEEEVGVIGRGVHEVQLQGI